METRMEELERQLEEVVRLMRGRNNARPRGRSPPRRETHRVETEDRWDGGPRRDRGAQNSPSLRRERRTSRYHHRAERYSPHSRESPPYHHDRSSWGNRSPQSSRESHHLAAVYGIERWSYQCSTEKTRWVGWSESRGTTRLMGLKGTNVWSWC